MLYGFVMILLPIKQYATLLVLRPIKLGLANPVAGPSRGTLFREVSIFLVVVRDAEPKKRRKLFSKLYVFFCQ